MLFLSSVLVATLILSTGTLSDIPDGEWTAPGVDIQLIESIDVSVYGEPLSDMLGRVSFVETAEGEKWRLVLVNTDNITILLEDEEVQQIRFGFCASMYFISPDNQFVVLVSNEISGNNAMRINCITGEMSGFRCSPDNIMANYLLVGNTGSVFSMYSGGMSFYDSELLTKQSTTRFQRGTHLIAGADDGSIIVIGYGTFFAFDENGEQIWENTELPTDIQYNRVVISPLQTELVVTARHKIYFLDLEDGHLLRSLDIIEESMGALIYGKVNDVICYSTYSGLASESGQIIGAINRESFFGEAAPILSHSYDTNERMRTISPSALSTSGNVLYQINQFPGEKILILADRNGKPMWSERIPRTPEMISGTSYRISHSSFGELASDGTSMCTYTDGSLNVYRIGAM